MTTLPFELPLTDTDSAWVSAALGDLDAVFCDHLHCERKAAQSALSLVRNYPARANLVAASACWPASANTTPRVLSARAWSGSSSSPGSSR